MICISALLSLIWRSISSFNLSKTTFHYRRKVSKGFSIVPAFIICYQIQFQMYQVLYMHGLEQYYFLCIRLLRLLSLDSFFKKPFAKWPIPTPIYWDYWKKYLEQERLSNHAMAPMDNQPLFACMIHRVSPKLSLAKLPIKHYQMLH